MTIKVKRLKEGAILPSRASAGSAGLDLCAFCPDADITVKPMQRVLIPTGIAVQLPSANYTALLFARSGLALRQGLCLANGVGVIDSDYRGEVQVAATNLSAQDIVVQHGQRIAQLLLMPVVPAVVEEVPSLENTSRGSGGFGSSGG